MNHSDPNLICVSRLSAGYHSVPVLQDISFEIPRGTISAVVGPNGCGKTTLLRTIAGLLPYQSGGILIGGRKLNSISRKEFARTLAFLPQVRQITGIPVESYVLHGRYPYLGLALRPSAKDRAIAEDAMRRTDVLRFRSKKITELSGGERQRVYFAMLIAQDADILILDEPATYLDINCQFELLALIEKLKAAGKTILMVLHDLSHALSFSDQILVLNDGRLLRTGTPAEIAESGLLQSIFHIQLKPETMPSGKLYYHLLPHTV